MMMKEDRPDISCQLAELNAVLCLDEAGKLK